MEKKNPVMVAAGKKAWETRRRNGNTSNAKLHDETPVDYKVDPGYTITFPAVKLEDRKWDANGMYVGKMITLTGTVAKFYENYYGAVQDHNDFDNTSPDFHYVVRPTTEHLNTSMFEGISQRQFRNFCNQLRNAELLFCGENQDTLDVGASCIWFPPEWAV